MNWDYRKWKPRTRVIWVFIIGIASIIFFATKGHAEETVGEHLKEAVFDTVAAAAAFTGAAQQAATGNFVNGAMLAILGGREVINAYNEYRAAWDVYHSYDGTDDYDRNISPNEAAMDHGRD